jgi:hypothetical protein
MLWVIQLFDIEMSDPGASSVSRLRVGLARCEVCICVPSDWHVFAVDGSDGVALGAVPQAWSEVAAIFYNIVTPGVVGNIRAASPSSL